MKTVRLGDRDVPIIDGGFFDRYRMEPDLREVAAMPGVGNVDHFADTRKAVVEFEGVQFMMPCFYYDAGLIQVVYTAKVSKLRDLLPTDKLEPVQVMPGVGLIALSAFNYRICDIDPYHEFAISVLTKKPGRRTIGALGLAWDQLRNESWAYVWTLPVDTEIARLGGRIGYNYPKYVTDLPYEDFGGRVEASILHEGAADVTIVGRVLRTGKERVNVSHAMSVKDGAVFDVPVRIKAFSYAKSLSQDACRLELGGGPKADVLRGVEVGRLVQYEYIPRAQIILPAGTAIC